MTVWGSHLLDSIEDVLRWNCGPFVAAQTGTPQDKLPDEPREITHIRFHQTARLPDGKRVAPNLPVKPYVRHGIGKVTRGRNLSLAVTS